MKAKPKPGPKKKSPPAPPSKMRLVIPMLIVSDGKGLAWGVGDARIEKDGEPE